MSIRMVFNTALMALNAQQTGLTVTGHNIANVNSPHYSRQTLNQEPKDPIFYEGFWIGTGVEASSIQRSVDQSLENRLMDYTSDYQASKEASAYMNILETAFNENTDNGINTIMSQFWNSWLDLSNNPTGSPERVAVYEKGVHIAERLDTLTNDLARIETDMNNEITAIVSSVGNIASQIAELNNTIIGQQSGNVSLDMMDHRNGLVYDLAELVDVNSFEQPDGSLTVMTAGGYNLVSGATSRDLTLSSSRVMWESSQGSTVDITDKLTSGKIKGWLEMRDEIATKYQAEVDALAKEFIWAVNYQHSQGVGQQYADSAVTGTYATDSSEMLNTLAFGHKIDYTEDFKMYVNTSGSSLYPFVTVDMAVSTAMPTYPGGDFFSQNNSTYTITVTGITGGGVVGTDEITFAWSETAGSTSGTQTLIAGGNTVDIDGMLLTFSAGDVLVAGNTLKINTDDNAGGGDDVAVSLTPSGTANSILDNYKFTVSSVTGDGEVGTDTITVDWSNSNTTGSFTLDSSTTTATVDGMTLTFAAGGWFVADDVFTIETDSTGSPTAYMMSDWHWTLDSFGDQFNREATAAGMGVTASKTSDDKITFTPGANNSIGFPGSYTTAEVTSSDGTLVNVTTMATLGAGELSLNGTTIRAAAAGDDTASSTDNAGSAIATAAAINASSSTTGVQAYAEKTKTSMVLDGTGNPSIGLNELLINGTAIDAVAWDTNIDTTAAALVVEIDQQSSTTGVSASYNTDTNTLTLTSTDGRNIQIETASAGAATIMGADFANGDNKVIRGNVSLYSDAAITIGGTSPGDVGFTAGSVALATSTDPGLTAALGINTFFDGIDAQTISVNSVLTNKDYIAAAQIDLTDGTFGVGDSRNATDIANIQHSTRSVAQWTYTRGSDATSSVLNVSMENYYQTVIGTMGIKSAELSLTAEYKYEMMGRITEQRDNLSAVSLDEEMINLMKYQQAYTMASKLISVGDEMLMTLINAK